MARQGSKGSSQETGAKGFGKSPDTRTPEQTLRASPKSLLNDLEHVPETLQTGCEQGAVSFDSVFLNSRVKSLTHVVSQAGEQLTNLGEEATSLARKMTDFEGLFSNPDKTTEFITFLVEAKAISSKMLSWQSVGVEAAIDFLRLAEESDNQELLNLVRTIEEVLPNLYNSVEQALSSWSGQKFFGVSLDADQMQVSETRASISKAHQIIETIKQKQARKNREPRSKRKVGSAAGQVVIHKEFFEPLFE